MAPDERATTKAGGVIRRSAEEMHEIHCPNCGKTVGETRLVPSLLNRYKCQRCGHWTWLVVPGPGLPSAIDTAA